MKLAPPIRLPLCAGMEFRHAPGVASRAAASAYHRLPKQGDHRSVGEAVEWRLGRLDLALVAAGVAEQVEPHALAAEIAERDRLVLLVSVAHRKRARGNSLSNCLEALLLRQRQ